MKRIVLLLFMSITSLLVSAQTDYLTIHKKNGITYDILVDEIDSISFSTQKEEDVPMIPELSEYVKTGPIESVSINSAKVSAIATVPSSISLYAIGILYSTEKNITKDNSVMLSKNITNSNLSKEYKCNFAIGNLSMNTTYYYRSFVYIVSTGKYYYGDIMSFTTCGDITDGDMIDLGLTSGVCWASMNLGAASPYEYGDLFAWGETKSKDSFSIDNYLYYFNGDYFNIGYDISKSEYDAARQMWGESWRIPTNSDYYELIYQCVWSQSTINDTQGYIVTGPNGNSIFLPFNELENSVLSEKGVHGIYWTSNANALNLFSFNNYMSLSGYNRENGFSIRPVYCGNDIPDTPTDGTGTKTAPLSVADAKSKVGSSGYVTGYIVGYIDGTKLEEGAKFDAAYATETEVLLADNPSCKDPSLCFPVHLPSGDIRTALNPATASNIGKKVTVYGSIETYFGTIGMKSTSWATIDGKEIGVDPEAPVTPPADPKGDGTKASPFNVSAAIAYVEKLPSDVESDDVMYIEGIVCNEPNINATQYYNATFKISDDGIESSNNVLIAYQVYGLGGQKITDENYVKKGDKVILCGRIVNYKGNTPETVGKGATYIYSLNGKTDDKEEGGQEETPPGSSDGVSVSGTTVTLTNTAATAGTESISIDLSTLGLENAAEIGTVTLSDGTTIVFAAGSNSNAPKYYTATKGARVYANNTITFNGKSAIANVVMECDEYNGTNYVGNATATIAVDGNTLIYNNASASAGVQLRVKTITITYAK